MLRKRSINTFCVVVLLAVGGCLSTDGNDGKTATTIAELKLSESHEIRFMEAEPGVTFLNEDVGKGEQALLETDSFVAIARDPLIDQYRLLSGSNSVPSGVRSVLDAAEQRRHLFRERVRTGELRPPPQQAPSPAPLVDKWYSTDTEYDWPYSASYFYSVDCPANTFSGTWCSNIPSGSYTDGWSANTSFYRSSAFNSSGASGYYWHRVQQWNGSAWAEVWFERHFSNSKVYSLYATDFPWTLTYFVSTSNDQAHHHAAAVWNF